MKDDIKYKEALEEFKVAEAIMLEKELALNKFVEVRIKSLIAKEDIDGLQELVDEMPKHHFKGTRRIYEAIIKLDMKREKKNG